VCHPILYSFVSWRAGGCWGGGETRIPRLSVQQEEKRVARKGCKGVRQRVAGGKGKSREGSKGKGTAPSSHDQYTGSRWGGCEKRLCFSWHGTPRSWLFYHWDPASVWLSPSLDALQPSYFAGLQNPSPPQRPYPQASLTLRHHTFSRRAVHVRLIFNPCLTRSAITLGIIRQGWMVEREGMAWRNKSH